MAVSTNTFTGLSQSVREEEVTPKPYVQPTSDTAQSSLDNITEPSVPKKSKKRRSRSSSSFVQPTSDTAQSSLDNITEPSIPKPTPKKDFIKVYTPTNQQREEALIRQRATTQNLPSSNSEVSSLSSSNVIDVEQKKGFFSYERTFGGEVLSPAQRLQEKNARLLAKKEAEENKSFWDKAGIVGLQVSETVIDETVGFSAFVQDRFKTAEEKKSLAEERKETTGKQKFNNLLLTAGSLGGSLRLETEPVPVAKQLTYAGLFFVGPEILVQKLGAKAEKEGSEQLFRLLNEASVDPALKYVKPQKISIAEQTPTFNAETNVINLGPTREVMSDGAIRLRNPNDPVSFQSEFQSQLIPKDISNIDIDPFSGLPVSRAEKDIFATESLFKDRQVSFKEKSARPFSEAKETTITFLNVDDTPRISILEGGSVNTVNPQSKLFISSPEAEFRGLFGEQNQLTSKIIDLDASPIIKLSPSNDLFKSPTVTPPTKKTKLFAFTDPISLTKEIVSDPDIGFKALKEMNIGNRIKSAQDNTIKILNQPITPSLSIKTNTLGLAFAIDSQPVSKSFLVQPQPTKLLDVDTSNVLESKSFLDTSKEKVNVVDQIPKLKEDTVILPVLDVRTKSKTRQKSISLLDTKLITETEIVTEKDVFQVEKTVFDTKRVSRTLERPKPPRGFNPYIPSFKKVYSPLNNNFFVAEVKSRGSFLKASSPVSYEEAFSKGVFGVRNTASASFRIMNVRTGLFVKPRKSLSKDLGISKRDDEVIIQRRGFRIGSAGEKREITLKGIFASKNKKKNKRFNLWE